MYYKSLYKSSIYSCARNVHNFFNFQDSYNFLKVALLLIYFVLLRIANYYVEPIFIRSKVISRFSAEYAKFFADSPGRRLLTTSSRWLAEG